MLGLLGESRSCPRLSRLSYTLDQQATGPFAQETATGCSVHSGIIFVA